MRISYLKEFCILASVLNFTKAAERLYITQPALSRHIAALEQEYGVVLIRRTTKNVELTEAGRQLRDALVPVIIEYEKAVSALKNKNLETPRSLHVGVPTLPLNNNLSNAPEMFRSANPGVDLNFYPDEPERNIAKLYAGKLDLIMIGDMPFPGSNQVVFHDFLDDLMVILCSDRYPISRRERVTLSDLKNYTFLCKNSAYYSIMWERIALQCKWSGFEPAVRYYDSYGEALMAVRQGFGVIALTSHYKALATDGLSWMTLDEPTCRIRSALAYMKDNTNPMIHAFIETYSVYGASLSE